MSLSHDLERVFREEARRALGTEVSPATIGQDIVSVLSALSPQDARSFAARISDAALDYLVRTGAADEPPDPSTPEPGPAAPDAPEPIAATAPADAVAETSPDEESGDEAA